MTAYQQSFLLPVVAVDAPVMSVSRSVSGTPPVEAISGITVQQTISITGPPGNPSTRGFTSFTWTWVPGPGPGTSDLATALTQAGWAGSLPCLDPTRTYQVTFAVNP